MPTARNHRSLHRLGLGAAMLAVLAGPLAMAVPAEATTKANGCSVKPLAPAGAGVNGAGVKQVRYDVVISCAGNRSIEVQQMFFEKDQPPKADDFTGTQITTRNFVGPNIVMRGTTRSLPDTEATAEEIYQRARFRVSVNGGAQSAWTPFESGNVVTVTN